MIIIDIPHSGTHMPFEVIPYLHKNLTKVDLTIDSDEFVNDVYLVDQHDYQVVRGNYWRAFIDFNRNEEDFSSDGIVKTHTTHGKQIYVSEEGLPDSIRHDIIGKYFLPYKSKLKSLIQQEEINYLLLCHTMSGHSVPNSEYAIDDHRLRPLFCLVNEGDSEGNSNNGHADKEILTDVKNIIKNSIPDLDLDFTYADEVCFNYPFASFGSRFPAETLQNKNTLAIEINRELLRKSMKNISMCQLVFLEILEYLESREK